jgi:tRNA 5-methylaminomethyl-2-thiouridine biosynthesis bifunctional protein
MQLLDLSFQNHSDCLLAHSKTIGLSAYKLPTNWSWVAYSNQALYLDASLIALLKLPDIAIEVLANKKLEIGFHRFYLYPNSNIQEVVLTLCIGPLDKTLAQLQSSFDYIIASNSQWSDFTATQLSRLSHLNSQLLSTQVQNQHEAQLQQVGFVMTQPSSNPTPSPLKIWCYQPAFKPKGLVSSAKILSKDSKIVIIGAGLCGAITAYLLAKHGYRVQLLEAQAQVAAKASGLPAGLIVPQNSQNNGLAALTRQGLWATSQLLAQLGLDSDLDYCLDGVLEKNLRSSKTDSENNTNSLKPDFWHEMAGWIKPKSLIDAALNHPNIEVILKTPITKITRHNHLNHFDQNNQKNQPTGNWQLLSSNKQVFSADIVILANSTHISELLIHSSISWNQNAFQYMMGQVSWAKNQLNTILPNTSSITLPEFPVNGFGHLLPAVPLSQFLNKTQNYWMIGATYQQLPHNKLELAFNEQTTPQLVAQAHEYNFNRISVLLGENISQQLKNTLQNPQNPLLAWHGIRMVSQDRMPVLGQLDQHLFVCSAMGSRGLSLAALCSQTLVDSLLQINPPLAKADIKRLNPLRFI